MPILDLNDENKTPTEQIVLPEDGRVLYTDTDLKTSTLFNKDHDIETIVRYISGSKWEVSYFLQLIDVNDQLHIPDVNVPNTLLKYNRINNLILYLESGLDQTNPQDLSGTCKINAGFLPNYGDAFIATLIGGREALFYITEVKKQRYSLNEIYEVEFKLLEFLDVDSVLYRDLIYKTVREYSYDKNFLYDNSAPILLNQDYKKKLDLKEVRSDLIHYYFTTMVNGNKNIISPPVNSGVWLDTFITDFIFNIVDITEVPSVGKISRISYQGDVKYNILTAIIERDANMLRLIEKDIGFRTVPYFNGYPTVRALGYLNIEYVVDKVDDLTRVDIDIATNERVKPSDYVDYVSNTDNTYIFSNNFYSLNRSNCNLFEQCILDYINGSLISMDNLELLIKDYMLWDYIDQFYKIPILIVLIQDHIKNSYSSL